MSCNVRLATRSDAPAWIDLLRSTLGEEYPGRVVYDPEWVAAELSPQSERQTWVAESAGRLLAAISFLKPADANANPVANLGRCLFRPESLSTGAAQHLLSRIQDLAAARGQMAVARVPLGERMQQRLFEEAGFLCAGFQPCKHLAPRRHGVLFYVHSARPVLVHRLPLSESLPHVCELGSFVLQSLKLPGLVTVADGATGYPLQSEVRLEEISHDDYQVWRQHGAGQRLPDEIASGSNRGIGLLRLDAPEPPLALLAHRTTGPCAGLVLLVDPHDRCVRLADGFATDDLSLGALLSHAVRLASDRWHATYVEMDALMTAPRLLKTAEQLGFVPVAYLPAFMSRRGAFVDVVKLVKLNVAYELDAAEPAPGAAAIVEIANRYFEDQKLGVAVINLLRSLPVFEGLGDGELRKLARLFQQKLYRENEIVFHKGDAGTEAFIVLRGQVEVMLEDPPRPVASVLSGQVFGEQAFLDGSPRTATVMASQPSILLVVQRQAFHELAQREPHLGMMVMRNMALDLSNKLRRATTALALAKK